MASGHFSPRTTSSSPAHPRRRRLAASPDGGWVVLELNGAVEFTDEYSLDRDVFAAASDALVMAASRPRQEEVAALA